MNRYQAITLRNFDRIPQISRLSENTKFAIRVVGSVLPFRVNNYVVDELIDWDQAPNDPLFRLTFPQKDMLRPSHFAAVAAGLNGGMSKEKFGLLINQIRASLNPHPAGQMEHNVPHLDGKPVSGIQHKYRETVLFFPSQGQTCHAYCTFCFRWPQFVGVQALKFAARESNTLVRYLRMHPEVTDVLFTGGDPMIMKASVLEAYLEPILKARLPNLHTIRIGSKSLGYWPYKYLTDADAEETLNVFRRVRDYGLNVSFMAHFNHDRELDSRAVQLASERILQAGVQIRTQSPVMRHINDDPTIWAGMWRKQVDLGMIPYYMFIARNTGAQKYFSVPLVKAWEIFRQAYSGVSGICRTVRGPSMSAKPGKIQILGAPVIRGEKTFSLRFLQGRNPDWVQQPFFAAFDRQATWLTELRPAFGQADFFFSRKFEQPKTFSLMASMD